MMYDLLIDDTGDLAFAAGDLLTGESTVQHQELLLQSSKGHWKENPTTGVGIHGYLKDDDESVLNEIRTEFERDGMEVRLVNIDRENLEIDASYT